MRGVNVLVWGDEKLARAMAKQGTVSDVTLFNHLAIKTALTLAVPSRYPERLQSLLHSLALIDIALLVIEELTPQLGEIILALDCTGTERGFLVFRKGLTMANLAPLVSGTVAADYQVIEDDPDLIRQTLLDQPSPVSDGETVVDVDAAFLVKGIGVVVLGVVRRGLVRKGQQLQLYPGKRLVQMRSIQVHDADVKEAPSGCRVGLAIKNGEVGHFDRGSVLATPQTQQVVSSITVELETLPYFKEGYDRDMLFHIGAGMQLSPARVMGVEVPGEKRVILKMELERPLVLHDQRRLTLSYLNAKGPRIAGKVRTWST